MRSESDHISPLNLVQRVHTLRAWAEVSVCVILMNKRLTVCPGHKMIADICVPTECNPILVSVHLKR